jgi:hypothetical protein
VPIELVITAWRPSAVTSAVWPPVGVVGRGENHFVGGLRGADAVEPQRLVVIARLEVLALGRLGEARVEEAFLVDPGELGELGPVDLVGEPLARGDVEHAQHPPVAPTVLDAVGEVAACSDGLPVVERGGAVAGPARWGRAVAAALPCRPWRTKSCAGLQAELRV